MKIKSVEIQSVRLPVFRPHQMAIGTTYSQENVIVRLVAEDGSFGWGEAPHMVGHSQLGETPQTVRVILRHKLAPAILGKDFMNQEALVLALDRAVPGNGRAKGALMMAAYDLAGKALGTPVYNLLGGKVRDAIPLSWSLPIVETEKVVAEALQMVERGWRILKIKAGRPNAMDDVEVVRAVREAVGDSISLRVDVNQGYSLKTAYKVLEILEPCGLEFMEQPIHRDDMDGMVELTRRSSTPIMADEAVKSMDQLALIAKRRAADAISIYIIGPGSIGNSKKMATIVEAFNMRGYVGGALESVIGASAGLHLAASSPAIDLGCEMSGQYLLKEDLGRAMIPMKDGALVVPTQPGLGVEIDESKLTKYREGDIEVISA